MSGLVRRNGADHSRFWCDDDRLQCKKQGYNQEQVDEHSDGEEDHAHEPTGYEENRYDK